MRAPTVPMMLTSSALRLLVSPRMARASSLVTPSEMRCEWWVMYEIGRGHVYLVESVPARAILELACRVARNTRYKTNYVHVSIGQLHLAIAR